MNDVSRMGTVERVQAVLGIVAVLLAIVLVVTGGMNRSLQARVAAGQAKIANAQAAANVNNNLIRMLAKSAAENNDAQLRTLLARNGITFQQGAGSAAAAPPASTPAQ